MFSLNKNLLLTLVGILFFLSIIVISYNMWLVFACLFFILGINYIRGVEFRFVTSIFIAFLVSFLFYQLTNMLIDKLELSKAIRVLLNRILLVFFVVGMYFVHIIHKKKISFFNHKPKWNAPISMPFHSIKLSYFMIIGIIISGTIFIPFILQQGLSDLKSMLVISLLFSLINAPLEEFIWRGIILSSLKEFVSVKYALFISSIGFGLLHLAVGLPFIVSLLFSFGGLFYGVVVIKANSIYPAIILHFFINMGMVLSGMITE